MPDFIAGLFSATIFCLGFIGLNLLTRIAQPLVDLAESGLLQYAGAFLLAYAAWRRAVQNQAGVRTNDRSSRSR